MRKYWHATGRRQEKWVTVILEGTPAQIAPLSDDPAYHELQVRYMALFHNVCVEPVRIV